LISSGTGYSLLVGGLGALTDLSSVDGFGPDRHFYVFATQLRPRDLQTFARALESADSLVFVDTSLLDLAMSTVNASLEIDLSQYVAAVTGTGQWTRVDPLGLPPYDWGSFMRLGKAFTFSSGYSTLSIPVQPRGKRPLDLWARVLFSPNPSILEFQVDGKIVSKLYPHAPARDFRWVRVASITGENAPTEIALRSVSNSTDSIAVVDEILLVNDSELESHVSNLRGVLKENAYKTAYLLSSSRIASFSTSDSDFELISVPYRASNGHAASSGLHGVAHLGIDGFASGNLSAFLRAWGGPEGCLVNLALGESMATATTPLGNTNATSALDFQWTRLGDLRISEGPNAIALSVSGHMLIDQVILVPERFNELRTLVSEEFEPAPVAWRLENVNRFALQAGETQPLYFVVAETYDPHWSLWIRECRVRPVLANGYMMAFPVPSGCSARDSELRFDSETWSLVAVAISLVTFSLTLSILCACRFTKGRRVMNGTH